MSEPLVTLAHCRELGYCSSGLRAFFKRHGLDWATFVRVGLPAPIIESTGDAMAQRAAQRAREQGG